MVSMFKSFACGLILLRAKFLMNNFGAIFLLHVSSVTIFITMSCLTGYILKSYAFFPF